MMSRPALVAVLLAGGVLAAPSGWAQSGLSYGQPLNATALQNIQAKLAAQGAFTGTVNGVWGPDSQAALQNYQQSHGLQVTGQMNAATAATLGVDPATLVGSAAQAPAAPLPTAPVPIAPAPAAPAPAAPAPAPAAPPAPVLPPIPAAAPPPAAPAQPAPFALSADSVRIIQARLRELGLYTGAIDGEWGAGSQSAIQTFQSSHGLPADGRLTRQTIVAMGVDPASMQPR